MLLRIVQFVEMCIIILSLSEGFLLPFLFQNIKLDSFFSSLPLILFL